MSRSTVNPPAPQLPPLEHGDCLTPDEFLRRSRNMSDLKKAELIEGMVYLPAHTATTIDPSIPPLENGDHLTRAEFERRWENMPDLKKAELLNGKVFMPPPVSATRHGIPHSELIFWLTSYRARTPHVMVADNSTLRLVSQDDAQPDAMLLIQSEAGGRALLDSEGYVSGTPELVAEVAASSASYDLHAKLDVYQRARIPEYLVWRTYDGALDWFVLHGRKYQPLQASADGIVRSKVFPGLWVDPAALLRSDLASVLNVLQKGLASLEHVKFVSRLQQAASAK